MFYFRTPVQPNPLEPRDPTQVEQNRRVFTAPPSPFKASAPAVEQLGKHGAGFTHTDFISPAQVKARDVGTSPHVPPSDPATTTGEGELRREDATLRDAMPGSEKGDAGAVSVDFEKKEQVCKSRADFPATPGTSASKSAPQPRTRTLGGEGTVKDQPKPPRIRRQPEDIPWHERDLIDGHKVSRYISRPERERAIRAMFVAKARKHPLNMAIDLNPGVDDLTPLERMRFFMKIPNNINSYIQGRLDALKRPASWWPHHGIMARESNAETHREEHIHGLIHVPSRDEMNRLIDRLEKQRGNPLLRNWCGNPLGRTVDDVEVWKGGKLHSAISYLLKAADSHSTFVDPTILYKPSGAVLGKRVFITRTLTNPRVIASTEDDVARYVRARDRIRKEKRLAAIRRDAPPPSYLYE